MQGLEVIHTKNAEAVARSTAGAPEGTTHLVHCYTGLNLMTTRYAKSADEAEIIRAEHVGESPSNSCRVAKFEGRAQTAAQAA